MITTKSAGKIVFSVVSVFLFTGVFATEVAAGECDHIVAELRQIKGLIKRKAFLDEAVKGCADNYLVTYYYAYNFERRRKYDSALFYYNSAIALNPEYARSYFGLGDTYLALRENKQAVTALEKGLHLDPENIWAKKSLQKAREGLAVQAQQKAAAVSHEKIIKEEGVAPPPSSTTAETLTSVKQAEKTIKAEKDVTARDFIDRMQVDLSTPLDARDLVVRMPVQFNPSSGDLTPQAMEQLDSVVCKALQSDELTKSKFEVGGHTDSSGSFEYNMHLSRMRAHAVKKYLAESCGVEPDRLNVVYYGETRPLVPNISRENRRLNRRVEFRRVIGKDNMMQP